MLRDLRLAGLRRRSTAALLGFSLSVLALTPRTAAAEQKHVVRVGQSLGGIARQYGTTVSVLAAANSLDPDGILREGQQLRVPGAGSIQVGAGQTLGKIARDYRVSVTALAATNGISREANLQIGQRLLLPEGAVTPNAPGAAAGQNPAKLAVPAAKSDGVRADARKATAAKEVSAAARVTSKSAAARKAARSPWGKPKQAGVVELFRIWSKESVRVRLVNSKGTALQDARRTLREFLRPRDSQRRKSPNARLLSLLARVSDHFGGRPLHIVSGYRVAKGLTRKTSRHVAGEAIDFRIPGVPLTVLRDYCQQFPDVGVGYYPTTEFVHLDVRKQPARWTDWSLPGQPPVLNRPIDLDESGNEEVLSVPLTDETAERTSDDEPHRHADAPTG